MRQLHIAAIVGPLVWIAGLALDWTFAWSNCVTGKVWWLVVLNVVSMTAAVAGQTFDPIPVGDADLNATDGGGVFGSSACVDWYGDGEAFTCGRDLDMALSSFVRIHAHQRVRACGSTPELLSDRAAVLVV